MATDLKLSEAQISKIIQSGGFLGSLLTTLAGPSMKIAIPLAKNVLAPLGITAAASAGIKKTKNKKKDSSGNTTLIISDMNDILKIIETLENSNILLKGVTKTMKNETKEQKWGFLSLLLGTLGTSLLGNLLTGKGILRTRYGRPLSSFLKNNKGNGIVRAGSRRPLSSTLKNNQKKKKKRDF